MNETKEQKIQQAELQLMRCVDLSTESILRRHKKWHKEFMKERKGDYYNSWEQKEYYKRFTPKSKTIS